MKVHGRGRKLLCTILAVCLLAGLASISAYAADSTHITEAQQQMYSDDSWIQAQADTEAQIEQTFAQGDYTVDAPYVVVDPYGNNPLAALVMFRTDKATAAAVTVEVPADKGGAYNEESTFTACFDEYTTEHYLPVYALYNGKNTVTIVLSEESGESSVHTVEIETTVPTNYSTSAEMLVYDEKSEQHVNGLNFVSFVSGKAAKTMAYDLNGNLRVIFTNSGQSKIYALPNGHIAYQDINVLHGIYYTTGIIESDLMGKVHQRYLVNGIHHEFFIMENGNWFMNVELPNGETTEDYFVELDYETGEIVRDWWLYDSMDMVNFAANPYYEYRTDDWAHVNSMVQIPGEDAIWFSPRHNDGMYLLNLSTNEIEAAIAEDDDDYGEELKEKLLVPVISIDGESIPVEDWWLNGGYVTADGEYIMDSEGATAFNPEEKALNWHDPADPYFHINDENGTSLTPFEYTYGQHALTLIPQGFDDPWEGNIFVFDNGDGRSKVEELIISSTEERAARSVFSSEPEDSAAYQEAMTTNYSRAVIYRYDLEAGTVEQLWQYGKERGMELYSHFICDVDYIAPNHYILDFGGARTSGQNYSRIIEIYNDEIISEFNVGSTCYRVERIEPYYGTTTEYKLNETVGVQKGSLLMDRAELVDVSIPESIELSVGESVEIEAVIATNYDYPIDNAIWTVEDDGIVLVDENGIVTALATGETTVTATVSTAYTSDAATAVITVSK